MSAKRYDICPYCNVGMIVSFADGRRYGNTLTTDSFYPSVYYRCSKCNARSPMIELDEFHVDREAINDSIAEFINNKGRDN